jgi:hypothetical protein
VRFEATPYCQPEDTPDFGSPHSYARPSIPEEALSLPGAAAIAVGVVSWQPLAQASTIVANTETGQPLTRADCGRAGLAWDDNGHVCGNAATAETKSEAHWQRQYCAGMEIEKKLITGGRIDCFNDEFAIEVDWANKWAESVGQSLYYAGATNRKPGIILLSEQSEGPVEGLCRSYVYRLEYALKYVNAHVYVWTCAIDRDRKLDDCFRPKIQPTIEPAPAIATP